MRELIYLSNRKVEHMFSDAGRMPNRPIDASIGALGADAKVSVGAPQQSNDNDPSLVARKLERVIRYLDRTHRAVDFPCGELEPNQWIRFDYKAKYGKVHQDSAPEFTPEDIVLFGGSVPLNNSSTEVDLLLCGSVYHLRDQVIATGRMGSSTSWLYDFIKLTEKKEQKGIHVISEFPETRRYSRQREFDLKMAAHEAFGGLMRSSHPAPDSGRIRGHARVLLDVNDPRWTKRIVVASPLYVEIPAIKAKGSIWHRIRRKF